MKTCKKCNILKEDVEFYKTGSWCKTCQKSYKKQHYKSNPQKYKEGRIKHRKWYYDLKKDLKCIHCGINHPAVLEFHHMDPKQKDFMVNFSSMIGRTREEIMNEIKKCLVLCSNCHRIEHYNLNKHS